MSATISSFYSQRQNIIYLAAGGPGAACHVLVAACIHIGGHTAAWIIVALEKDMHSITLNMIDAFISDGDKWPITVLNVAWG